MFGLGKKRNEEVELEAENARRRPRHAEFKKRSARWPYYLLILLVLIFFLPNLIGWFGLHQTAINYAAADFRGKIQVEKFSAGWLQPVELSGVRVVDDQQRLLLEADSIRTSKKLFKLLGVSDYGQVTVDRPVVQVQMRLGGSNLEDALANYLSPTEQPDVEDGPTELPLSLIHI